MISGIMDTAETLALAQIAAQVAMGLTLAAMAGLRAFLPPLVLGLAARAGLVSLSPEFAWLAEAPALIALGSAVIFEFLGDKVPFVDHLLDVAGTLLRPAAGALVAGIPLVAAVHTLDSNPEKTLVWAAGITGIVAGGIVSGTVHMFKAAVRLGSTPATVGAANPLLSLTEDVIGLFGTVLAVLVPLLAFATLVLVVAGAVFLMRRRVAPQI